MRSRLRNLAAKISWRCRTAAGSLRDRPEACASRISVAFQTAPPSRAFPFEGRLICERYRTAALDRFSNLHSIVVPSSRSYRARIVFPPAYPRLTRGANFCRASGAELVSSGDCSNEARTEPRADRITLQLNTEFREEAEAGRGLPKKCNRRDRRVGRENTRSRDPAPFGGDEDSVSAVALGAALGREFNGPEACGGAEEFEAY